MSSEQKIRAGLFYLSVLIFFTGLPLILSFALGYRFNTKTFKFTKAGLIAIKTQPPGASIYLDGKLLSEKTPSTINELLPGKYSLRIELENHYAWISEVNVEAKKVTRLEKIILFPLRGNVSQLNKEKITSFWVDSDTQTVYYLNQEENIIYKSDSNGDNFKEIGLLPDMQPVKKCKVSPDKQKLLFFNPHQLAVVNLKLQADLIEPDSAIMQDYPNRKITDVFWHSDSYHLILVTEKNIEGVEASPNATPVNLLNLNKRNIVSFYDDKKDTLYFIDSQKAEDARFYDNVYQLELGTKFLTFKEMMKPRTNETK